MSHLGGTWYAMAHILQRLVCTHFAGWLLAKQARLWQNTEFRCTASMALLDVSTQWILAKCGWFTDRQRPRQDNYAKAALNGYIKTISKYSQLWIKPGHNLGTNFSGYISLIEAHIVKVKT